METLRGFKSLEEKRNAEDMGKYILSIIKGKGTIFAMSEKTRQFFTWGANSFVIFATENNNVGLQFKVTGLKFKGIVRIIYSYATDYFNIEFIKVKRVNILKSLNKEFKTTVFKSYTETIEIVKECEDIDFEQLHNILHKFIEREDDPEV